MMELKFEPYLTALNNLPVNGQHIIGHQSDGCIVVYQAYKKTIADFAVTNQQLGGTEFSYNRMSWIKPNFLWMMFRCGWAEKENQERVLAIWIECSDFEKLLGEAVVSTYDKKYHESYDAWKLELEQKEVRLQWDPDHDPYGNKIIRRAVQVGVKGKMLELFGKEYIKRIEDITGFVTTQRAYVNNNQLDKLLIPVERVYTPANETLFNSVGIDRLQ